MIIPTWIMGRQWLQPLCRRRTKKNGFCVRRLKKNASFLKSCPRFTTFQLPVAQISFYQRRKREPQPIFYFTIKREFAIIIREKISYADSVHAVTNDHAWFECDGFRVQMLVDVARRLQRVSWLTNSALVYTSPNAGEWEGLRSLSQWVHLCT